MSKLVVKGLSQERQLAPKASPHDPALRLESGRGQVHRALRVSAYNSILKMRELVVK